jgi:hypothetical protein
MGASKMATRIQLQIAWALWSTDFVERIETHVAKVKAQGRAETSALW